MDLLLRPLSLLWERFPNEGHTRLRLKVAFGVLLFGGLWITFSDSLGTALFPSLDSYERFQTTKGLLFIGCMALFIDLLLSRHTQRIAHLERDAAVQLARLRTALKASGAAIWEFRPVPGPGRRPTGRVYAGENVADMFRLGEAGASYDLQQCMDWLMPADAAVVEQLVEDCLSGARQQLDVTVRLRRSSRPLRLVGRPSSQELAPAHRSWVGVVIDLSESAALAERANLLELLFSAAPDALAVLDPTLQLRTTNEAFRRLLDDGRSLRDLVTPDGQGLDALLTRALQQGTWQGRLRLGEDARPRVARMLAVRPRGGVASSVVLVIHADVTAERPAISGSSATRLRLPIPPRQDFEARLRDLLERQDSHCAVMVFRFDGLPEINNVYGLAQGDELIRQLAQRFADLDPVRSTHLAGGKFALLLEWAPPQDQLNDWLGTVAEPLFAVLKLDQDEWKPKLRIGIAYARSGQTGSELIHAAETAARQHRLSAADRFVVFDSHLALLAREELGTVQAISRGLDKGEFDCVFQPQFELSSGRLCGAEALLRWFSPGGLARPERFIPLGEKHGLMDQLGAVALHSALRRTAQWRSQGLIDGNFRISVNLSAAQFRDGWEQQILDALDQVGLPGRQLCLEITESLAIQHHARVVPALRRLREHGVHVALDDFGTGHSSLLQLRTLPVDELKIDRSFVKDLSDSGEPYAMIHAMLSMGQALHLSLVAEGIESHAQARLLARMGCAIGQGFWLRRPISARSFEKFCRAHLPQDMASRIRRMHIGERLAS